jgi:hypothetical protein
MGHQGRKSTPQPAVQASPEIPGVQWMGIHVQPHTLSTVFLYTIDRQADVTAEL